MPRQDVPYPGAAICSLKERIAELSDEIDQLMKSINGVEGDGNGNVKLLSGNAALTINNDQVNKEITLNLDPAQLPAAAVASVNGQTGAVVLDASDIGSTNGDVQTDIDNLGSADSTLQTNINNEALARQNADSVLQGNINAALATIPGAAATAVSNDATVQQLTSDVTALQTADQNNVKLTGSQTITGIKDVPLQTTGNYDGQIASSQKVKNELDNYAPMVRTTGNVTRAGTFENQAPIIVTNGHDNTYIQFKNSRLNNHFSNQSEGVLSICDGNGFQVAALVIRSNTQGIRQLDVLVRNSDDSSFTTVNLAISS